MCFRRVEFSFFLISSFSFLLFIYLFILLEFLEWEPIWRIHPSIHPSRWGPIWRIHPSIHPSRLLQWAQQPPVGGFCCCPFSLSLSLPSRKEERISNRKGRQGKEGRKEGRRKKKRKKKKRRRKSPEFMGTQLTFISSCCMCHSVHNNSHFSLSKWCSSSIIIIINSFLEWLMGERKSAVITCARWTHKNLYHTTTVCVQQEGRSPTRRRRRGGGGQGQGQGPSSLNRMRTLSRILTTTCSWITQSKTCFFCCCWIEFYCKKLGARHKPLFFFFFSYLVWGLAFACLSRLRRRIAFSFLLFFCFCRVLSIDMGQFGRSWKKFSHDLRIQADFWVAVNESLVGRSC